MLVAPDVGEGAVRMTRPPTLVLAALSEQQRAAEHADRGDGAEHQGQLPRRLARRRRVLEQRQAADRHQDAAEREARSRGEDGGAGVVVLGELGAE